MIRAMRHVDLLDRRYSRFKLRSGMSVTSREVGSLAQHNHEVCSSTGLQYGTITHVVVYIWAFLQFNRLLIAMQEPVSSSKHPVGDEVR